MSQAVSIGPWVLAVGVVALALGFLAANLVAGFLKRRGFPDAGNPLWYILLLSLVVARLAWVVQWWAAYSQSPWNILDIRDGGFSWPVGVLTLVVATAVQVWRRPAQRRVLPASVGSGLLVWALVGLVAWQLQEAAHPPLPDLALRGLDGTTTTLAEYRGKPMVINLWATWCGPCRREMPMLVEASHAMSDVDFLFIDQGESAAAVREWLNAEGLAPEHVLIDGGSELSHHYNAPGYPTTLFVDSSGRLRDSRVGPLTGASLRVHLGNLQIPSTEK